MNQHVTENHLQNETMHDIDEKNKMDTDRCHTFFVYKTRQLQVDHSISVQCDAPVEHFRS